MQKVWYDTSRTLGGLRIWRHNLLNPSRSMYAESSDEEQPPPIPEVPLRPDDMTVHFYLASRAESLHACVSFSKLSFKLSTLN